SNTKGTTEASTPPSSGRPTRSKRVRNSTRHCTDGRVIRTTSKVWMRWSPARLPMERLSTSSKTPTRSNPPRATRGRLRRAGNISFSLSRITPEQRREAEDSAYRQASASRIANTDDVRPRIPGYEQADPLTRDKEFHQAASDLNKRVIARLYAEPPNGEPVVILAGGAGSGKTSASGINETAKDSAIAPVLGGKGAIERHVAGPRANGREAVFLYVFTAFEKAFPRVIDRYLAPSEARLVPLSVIVDGHLGA